MTDAMSRTEDRQGNADSYSVGAEEGTVGTEISAETTEIGTEVTEAGTEIGTEATQGTASTEATQGTEASTEATEVRTEEDDEAGDQPVRSAQAAPAAGLNRGPDLDELPDGTRITCAREPTAVAAPRRPRKPGGGRRPRARDDTARIASADGDVDFLDETMSSADLEFVLAHLCFAERGMSTIKLDRGVTRFLMDSLRARRGRAAA